MTIVETRPLADLAVCSAMMLANEAGATATLKALVSNPADFRTTFIHAHVTARQTVESGYAVFLCNEPTTAAYVYPRGPQEYTSPFWSLAEDGISVEEFTCIWMDASEDAHELWGRFVIAPGC